MSWLQLLVSQGNTLSPVKSASQRSDVLEVSCQEEMLEIMDHWRILRWNVEKKFHRNFLWGLESVHLRQRRPSGPQNPGEASAW